MAKMDLRPDFERFVATLASRTAYSGKPLSPTLVKMLAIEIRPSGGGGVLAPPWFSVTEHGRGPRKSKRDSGLVKRIYAWMRRNNMFHSKTAAGQWAEAKSMTWYINKHGNAQFRSKTFVDIYTTARERTIQDIYAKYSLEIARITKPII
jgi:hypothetical protein